MEEYFQIVFPVSRLFGELSDEDFRHIPHPKFELATHVTLKCVQMGTAIGTCYGSYLALSKEATRSVIGWRLNVMKMGRRGLVAGLLLGPALTHVYTTVNEIDGEAMYERCYRLRHNNNQLRTDRWMVLNGMLGSVLSNRSNMGRFYGILWGITVSLFATTVYNCFLMLRKLPEKTTKAV